MDRVNTALIVLCLLLLVGNGWLLYERMGTNAAAQGAPQHTPEEPELAGYMGDMQHYSHKLMLATQARDAQAAGFYLHELEELSETVEAEAPTYEGYEIGALVGSMLVPALTELDEAMDQEQWDRIDARIERLTTACNQCHEATDHGFIRITSTDLANPYNQTFGPAPE